LKVSLAVIVKINDNAYDPEIKDIFQFKKMYIIDVIVVKATNVFRGLKYGDEEK
jgi:hypothetical protein